MVEPEFIPKENPNSSASQKRDENAAKTSELSLKEKSLEQKIKESWNKRDGDLSEVIDSEGHRVRINHY